MFYFSQSKQDEFLDKVIFRRSRGVFVDIGAYDGVSYSNTYVFEKERGWLGICIEPIPEVFEKLTENRNCICINGCIANDNGKSKFLWVKGRSEMLSGLAGKYNERHLNRIDSEIKEFGGEKREIEVDCFKLNDLLNKYHIGKVDYCNIDVEGSELDILKSIDFDCFDFRVFTVENNYKDERLKDFMNSKGYEFIGRLDADQIYIKKEGNKKYFKYKLFIKYYFFLDKFREKILKTKYI